MVASVVARMELAKANPTSGLASVEVRLLGPLAIRRSGVELKLPASRKVRALVGYLALAPRPVTREHLCELLGDTSSDPRGELRWCLSKLRGLIDDPDRARLRTSGQTVHLELGDCDVDALGIMTATQRGVAHMTAERARQLAALFAGDFLDALELERSPVFDSWLIGQRRRFRACHTAILEQLVKALPEDSAEVCPVLDEWLGLAALDQRAHELMLRTLARDGRIREGAEHLLGATRLFEAEGLDPRPLREVWQAATRQDPAQHSPPLSLLATAAGAADAAGPIEPVARRASIAVMPFVDVSGPTSAVSSMAGALVHDVITRLAKLRSVAVIAQGTVFALHERGVGPEAAGRALNVDYVATGSIRRDGRRVLVMLELIETHMARIIWTEDFDHVLDDTFLVLDEIGNRIVAALAGEIETAERNRAILKPPSSLDAWEAHHRGLWHMYRFNAHDNEQAQRFFRLAVRRDPTFSRAHAGLSFTHFQNAFLHRPIERGQEIELAFESAADALIADERDPAAHLAMGRALWLRGDQARCFAELESAVELSPHYALGHYTVGFVQSQSGDSQIAIEASDRARRLSPFDPLLFAMLASRALAHLRLGQFEEAAKWALDAARRPNAHVHILAIATHCLAAASRIEEARQLVASIRKSNPGYDVESYIGSFRFSADAASLARERARLIGFGG